MEKHWRRLIGKPDMDPKRALQMADELSQPLDLVQMLVQGYAEHGPESTRKLCRKFLEHRENDRVGLIAFPHETLQRPIAISNEEIVGKRKFMLMVSPLLHQQMCSPDTSLEVEKQVLRAVKALVEEIDESLQKGDEIMTSAEYDELIRLSRQSRN
ncbi:MAG: hypothetical protein AAB512_00695 [Patescibacteria group bacterium]